MFRENDQGGKIVVNLSVGDRVDLTDFHFPDGAAVNSQLVEHDGGTSLTIGNLEIFFQTVDVNEVREAFLL